MKSTSFRNLSLGILLLLSVGCHNPYKSGVDALSEGNYGAAEKHAREVLREDPQNPEFNLLLADALVGKEEFKQAEPHAVKAFGAKHLKGPAGRTLGKVRWELGQPVGAVEAWRAARKADPSSVKDEDYIRALETALSAAMSVRDFETTLVLRSELKGYLPDHPEVQPEAFRNNHEMYADELVRDGRVEDAIAVFGQLSEEFGDDKYQFERGRLYAHLGDEEAAKAAFQKYVDAGPESEAGDRMLAVASRAKGLGAMTVAVHFYDQAIQGMRVPTVKRADLHRTLGVLFLRVQMSDQGATHLKQYLQDLAAVRGGKAGANDYVKAAKSAADNRAPQLAISLLEEAIVVAQPNWRVSRTLADLYVHRAKTQDVERVLNLYVQRSDSPSRAKINVGRWASSRKNYELAKHFLESAAQDNVSMSIWLELARIYAALGHTQDLKRALNSYAKGSKDKRRAYLDIAGIYRSQRMYEEAEEALKTIVKQDPTDQHVARQLETLYRDWGRPNKIHEVYAKWLKARGNKADDFQMVGERFLRQNEWDDALPYLKKAAERGDAEAWLQVADIYKRQRKERDMKRALDAYLAKAPNRVSALQMVWQRYRTSAWGHEAIPFLEELISLEPHNVVHYEQLSELYFEQGREVEAFELWKRYIEYSKNPIASLESMGRRFERRGLYDWMLAFLHQLLDKTEKPDPQIYRLLGDAYYAKLTRRVRGIATDSNAIFSQENKAKEYYEKYLKEGKPEGRELEQFATSMHRKRVWDVAAEAYERLDLTAPMSAHRLLEYGSVLLNLGRSEEATKVLAEYFEQRGGSVDAARAVADEMATASQYDAVEPYLVRMMDSGDENLIRAGFMQLSEVYRQTDRGDEIAKLANEYLSKTQNPSDARRMVLNVLEGAGRWDDTVQQLERIASIQGDEFKFEFGVALFRQGDDDRAESVFREFATGSVTSGESWLRVAGFYEGHGKGDLADEAYDLAVSGSPSNDAVLLERGRFRILRGRIEDGRGDMEEARSLVDQGRRWPIWKAEVQALLQVGQHEQARQAARDALALAFVEREYFYTVIAESELSSGDAVRAQRMVDELTSAGLPPDVLATILYQYGFIEDLVALIESEISTGDYLLGGQLAVSFAEVFTDLGGFERLLRALQPLLERGSRDGKLSGQVGEYLIREGEYERGVLFLRAAVDQGESSLRPLLAATYLRLGHQEEALKLSQSHLASLPDNGQEIAILGVAWHFELMGDYKTLEALLRHLSSEGRYAADAMPLLARSLVRQGRVAEVLGFVRAMWTTLQLDAETPVPNLEQRLDLATSIMVGVAEAIAGEGYMAEAFALVDESPLAVNDAEQVRDLRLRLAAASDRGPNAEVELALSALGESPKELMQRLKVARLLLTAGNHGTARSIAKPLLSNGDFGVAAESLRVLLAAAVLSGDESAYEALANEFVKSRPDKVDARRFASEALMYVGQDRSALVLKRRNYELMPTDSVVRHTMVAAIQGSDMPLFESAVQSYWRVSPEPMADVFGFMSNALFFHEPRVLRAYLSPYRSVFPNVWAARSAEIQLNYRIGEPELARNEILDHLEQVEFEPLAVESVLVMLDELRLWGEISKVVGPKLDANKITVKSMGILGRAALLLGDKDDALQLLDQFVNTAPDPVRAAGRLSHTLVSEGFDSEALRYAEMAVASRPGRNLSYAYRAHARLALGDASGVEDAERALGAGVGRQIFLYRFGRAALRSGLNELADKYLYDLAISPSAPESDIQSLRFALAAYSAEEKFPEGVGFLERHWPMIAAGDGASGATLLPTIAGLYETAGLQERSYSLYETGILRERVAAPFEPQLNTYRNNLAYTYSTTNKNLDRGLELINLAISSDRSRNASFIDTLGWLKYRQGDLVQAEHHVLQSLGSARGGASEMEELYEHLAEIKHRRGYHYEALWIEIYLESIRRR